MRKYIVSISATVIALTFFAFVKPKQLDTPDCTSIIQYFKVNGTFHNCDLAAQNGLAFPIPNDQAHVDSNNEAGNPFGCDNTSATICCIGYDATEVQLNPFTNKWELKSGKVPSNFRCCVRDKLR